MEADTISQQQRERHKGISFPVHEVEAETPELERSSMVDSLLACLKSGVDYVPEVVAVSDPEGRFLQLPAQNGLLAAVHLAFSKHLPLTLSPDVIWLAILQGFARHVKVHAAQLEGRLMAQPGKHTIQVVVGHEEWNWPMVFSQFATALEGHVGTQIRELEADFSTSGPVERTASHVALLDVFSPYVQYVVYCVCGIPSITLHGTEADWVRLREKLGRLRGYEADEWIAELDEIVARFVDASRGEVDREWWQQIYKLTPRYGGEDIEGWLGAFFPYLRDQQWTFARRRVKGEKFNTDVVPPGLSDVQLDFVTGEGKESLRVVAGFAGVEDLGAEGVMPKIGWAVVRNPFEQFLATIAEHPGIKTRPCPPRVEGPSREHAWLDRDAAETLPIDLQLFYQTTDGADLYGQGVIHPLATLLATALVDYRWRHLGAWNDGSLLLADNAVVRLRWSGGAWEKQTIALTFSDFLARLTAANGRAYWQDADFIEPEISPGWMMLRRPASAPDDIAGKLEGLRTQNRKLRAKNGWDFDLFVIAGGVQENLGHLPPPLRRLYGACDGVAQLGGFTVWPSFRAVEVSGTQGRWYEIGAAPGYRIIYDVAADRGLAAIAIAEERVDQIARTFGEFFREVAESPGGLFWDKAQNPSTLQYRTHFILWPDEQISGVSEVLS